MKTLYKQLIGVIAILFAVTANAQLAAPVNFPLPSNLTSVGVSAAEYYFDADPGLGNGVGIPLVPGSDVSVNNFSVAIDTLSTGVHRLFVRVKNGNGEWSLCSEANIFIIPQGALIPENSVTANISAAEYFLDNDPGFGHATGIPVATGTNISAGNIAVSTDTLSVGVHRIYVRTKNTNGSWSMTNVAGFYIVQSDVLIPANPGMTSISAAEYFLDNDPGLGHGTSIPVPAGTNIAAGNIAVPIDTLGEGVHRIYVRARNASGQWSMTNQATFYIVPVSFNIPSNDAPGVITALEYFFDTDPGFGNGNLIAIMPTTDLPDYQIVADISGLQQDTIHTLYIRALDGWSQTTTTNFTIGSPLALQWLSFTGQLQPDNSVLLQWATASEHAQDDFYVQRSRDGVSFTNIAKLNGTDTPDEPHRYRFVDRKPPGGNVFYRIREMDNAGHGVYSVILPIRISAPFSRFYIINNPAKAVLRVYTGDRTMNAKLEIFNMNGELLKQMQATGAAIEQIDVTALSAGSYVLQYSSPTKRVSRKFIKE